MVKWIKNYKKYARVKMNYATGKIDNESYAREKKTTFKWKKNYG